MVVSLRMTDEERSLADVYLKAVIRISLLASTPSI